MICYKNVTKEELEEFIENLINSSSELSSFKKNFTVNLDFESNELYIIFNLPICYTVVNEDLYFKIFEMISVPLFTYLTLKPVFQMSVQEIKSNNINTARAFSYKFKNGVTERLFFKNFEEYKEYILKENNFYLMKDYCIDLREQFSTVLISGTTGSGKTTFLKIFIESFKCINKNSEIIVIDIKKDLAKVVYKNEDVEIIIPNKENLELFFVEVCKKLNSIYELIQFRNQEKFESNEEIEYKKILLVIDEIQVLNALLNNFKKYKEQFNSLLLSISLLARSSNISMILSGQEMSSKSIDTAIRNNSSINILLGRLNNNTMQYLFDDVKNLFIPSDSKKFGRGIIEYNNNIDYLLVPFFEKGI